MSKIIRYLGTTLLTLCAVMILGSASLIQAQDTTIEFSGEINAINENILTVGGITVDVGTAIVPADGLTIGMTVQVIGQPQEQTIIATIVVVTDFGTEPTPVPPEPAETTEPEVTQEVETPAPDVTVAPTTEPTMVSTVDPNGVPIIVIEGPVQAINVTSITIFDIDIEVDPASTVLTEIRIGDTVRVEGESSFEGDTIVIVAVNITIVQTTLVIVQNVNVNVGGAVYIPSLPPSCKRTKKGKVTCKKKSKKS